MVSPDDGLEIGAVYCKKGRSQKAVLTHGLQANRYDGEGRWSQVFGFHDNEGLSWLTPGEREKRLSKESVVGKVYTGATTLREILYPAEREEGWIQEGPNWRQRKQVVWWFRQQAGEKVYEWMPRKTFDIESARSVQTSYAYRSSGFNNPPRMVESAPTQ